MELYTSNWMILFPIAFSLFVAMRLSLGSLDEGKSSWMLLAVRSLIVNCFFFSMLALGVRGHFLSIAWLVMIGVFAIVFWWKRKRLERNAVLLTAMKAKTLPQQQTLAGYFVDENVGWVRRKGRALRRDLATGVPWGTALEVRGVASGVYEKLELRLRAMYGKSDDASSSSLMEPLEIESETERLLGRLMIFSWVVFVFPVVAVIMLYIVPTFEEIFEEFSIELPPITSFMISVADFSVNSGIAFLFALIPLALIAFLGVAGLIWLFPATLQLPLFRWLAKDYYLNSGFTALGCIAEREKDLVQALRKTANVVPVPHISRKFWNAGEQIQSGKETVKAFKQSGLLNGREAEALGFHLNSGSAQSEIAWGLKQLAEWRIERMLTNYSMMVQIAVVVLTLFFSCLVGLVGMGVIAALAQLVLSLS